MMISNFETFLPQTNFIIANKNFFPIIKKKLIFKQLTLTKVDYPNTNHLINPVYRNCDFLTT